jgi:hypothetical protein
MAEQVIIEFISDVSQLAPAVDQLEKMGKVEKSTAEQFKSTNTEVLKHVKTLEAVNATMGKIGQSGVPLKKTLVDLGAQVKGLSKSFMKDFQQGAKDALHAAGVSAEEFENALNNVTKESTSLKAQLREMVAALAQMKVSGQDNTEQYRALAQQAGQLKDAIADANQEVKNFGSDTSTLDGVLSLAGGIAGGFAAVQGAAALFGDESEELQQTLLRVNAAMAILQGLQQLQVVLQKESAAATLANTIATKAQTAATVIYNFVVGSSIGLMKAFRIALAATGVGLLVLGIVALVNAFKSSNKELERANQLLEQQKNLVEAYNEGVKSGIAIEEARAQAAGKSQSDLIRIQGRGLQIQRAGLIESNQLLAQQRDSLDRSSAAWALLNAQIFENTQTIRGLDNDILVKRIELEHTIAQEALQANVDVAQARLDGARKNSAAEFSLQRQLERQKAELEIFSAGQNAAKIIEIRAGLNKKLRDIDRAEREESQKEILAGIETQLLEAQAKSKAINERNTQEEVDLQKKLILTKAKFEAQAEGLNQKQITEIRTKGILDAAKLQRDFNKQSNKEVLEDFISRNNAELQKVNISEADKLSIIEDNIIAAAQIELDANEGLSAKIKEINAKRDRDIKEVRLASIRAVVEYELQLSAAIGGPEQRRLQAVQDNEKEILRVRIAAIDELLRINSSAIEKRIAALNKERQQGLIGQEEYNLSYEKLIDDQAKLFEDAEKKKQDIIKSTTELAKQQAIELTQTILDVTSEVIGVLDSLFQLQASKENASLEERKNRLQELRDAGAITEKEAIVRQKRLEADERRIKQQQAQREKSVAVFNAAIAIPQAVLKGLTTGGPILAAIYGALAAAQLAIVASRPLPKFGKGKKNKYEGFGEVGETGTELIQSGGRMYVADKRQIVWLGKDDKVFNPQETIQMLSGSPVNTEKIMPAASSSKGLKIDYDKFGKAVAKHVSTNVYVDGVHEQQIKQQQFTEWQTKRRSWG